MNKFINIVNISVVLLVQVGCGVYSQQTSLPISYQSNSCNDNTNPCDLCDKSKWSNSNAFNQEATQYLLEVGGNAASFFQIGCNLIGSGFNFTSISTTSTALITIVQDSVITMSPGYFVLSNIELFVENNAHVKIDSFTTSTGSTVNLHDNAEISVMGSFSASNKGTSVVNLYDSASLVVKENAQFDTLNLHISSTVSAINITLSSLSVDPDAAVYAGNTITLTKSASSQLLGKVVASTLVFNNNLKAFSLDLQYLTVPAGFSLTVTSSGTLKTKNIQLAGNLILENANLNIEADEMFLIQPPGIINLKGICVANFSNVAINYLNTTSLDNNKPNSLINIKNTVTFIGSFDLDATITLDTTATLQLSNDLVLEKCIKNYGGIVDVYQELTCNNDDLYLYLTNNTVPQLVINKGAAISLYKLYNYGGLIDVTSPSTKLVGNIESNGTISIEIDANLFVTGYIDLLNSSSIIIQGIGPNTTRAALEAVNPIKLTGDLYYNISAPPLYSHVAYFLVSSQELYLEGKFNSVNHNPGIELNITEMYQYPAEDDHSVVPMPDTFLVLYKNLLPIKKKHGLEIFLGIFIPLLVCGSIAGGLYYFYKKRQAAQTVLYHRLN